MSTPTEELPTEGRKRHYGPHWSEEVLFVAIVLAVSTLIGALIAGPRIFAGPAIDVASYSPSATNPDPSAHLDGVVAATFAPGVVAAEHQRVNYTSAPAFGGPHAAVWAPCNGVVYRHDLKQENAVASMEHGAVWVTYDPSYLTIAQTSALATKVAGMPYTFMSPFTGLDAAVSVQGWGRQLKLNDPTDLRLDAFIVSVRRNPVITPTMGGSCELTAPMAAVFDAGNAPPYTVGAPGSGAMQMDGTVAPVGGDG